MCKTQLNSNSIQISVPQPKRAPGIFPFLAANPLSVDQASSNPVRLPTAVRVHPKLKTDIKGGDVWLCLVVTQKKSTN